MAVYSPRLWSGPPPGLIRGPPPDSTAPAREACVTGTCRLEAVLQQPRARSQCRAARVSGGPRGAVALLSAAEGHETSLSIPPQATLIEGRRLSAAVGDAHGPAHPAPRCPSAAPAHATTAHVPAARAPSPLNALIIQSRTAADVLALYEEDFDDDPFNLAAALRRVGALGVAPASARLLRELVRRVAQSLSKDAGRWDAKPLASAARGLANICAAAEVPKKSEAEAPEASKAEAAEAEAPGGEVSIWACPRVQGHWRPSFGAVHAAAAAWEPAAQWVDAAAPVIWADGAGVSSRTVGRATAPQKASNAARKALGDVGIGLFAALAAEAVLKVATFDAEDMADITWAFAKAGVPAPSLFKAAAAQAWAKLANFEAHQLADVAWAYHAAGEAERHGPLFEAVSKAAAKKMATFDAPEIASIVRTFAEAGFEAPALFEAIKAAALGKMEKFTTKELSDIVWTFSTLGVQAPLLFQAVVEALENVEALDAKALSNVVWALSMAGIKAPLLFEKCASEVQRKIQSFDAQNLAVISRAYATAGFKATLLFDAVSKEAVKKIATFEADELAAIVWSYALAGVEAPLLFEAVSKEASKTISDFEAQNLAELAWAFATAGVEASLMFEAVALEAVKKIVQCKPRTLANLLWAYAQLRIDAPPLFGAIAAEALKTIATFNAQNLSNLVWSLATQGVEAKALFQAVSLYACEKMASFNSHEVANVAWAFSIMAVDAPLLMDAIALKIISLTLQAFDGPGLAKLYTVYVHLRQHSLKYLTLLLSCYKDELRQAFLQEEPRPPTGQMDLSRALSKIGWMHEYEHVTVEGLSLDMAQPSSKLAVEFYGPSRYIAGLSGYADGGPLGGPGGGASGGGAAVVDGETRFKERLLRKLGWKMISVPHFQWDALHPDDHETFAKDLRRRHTKHRLPRRVNRPKPANGAASPSDSW